MGVSIVFFLGLMVALLVGAHAFVFTSAAHFFTFSPLARKILQGALAILALSFPVATWIAHRYESAFTRTLYFIASGWLGVLVNLVLAFLVSWTVLFIFQAIRPDAPLEWIGATCVALAVLFSAYGIWHAFDPQVKRITVSIPNLPAEWKGKTIVQLTDVHLGHIYRDRFLAGIVRQVNALDPEMVVITGDLFDGMDGNLGVLVGPLDDLRSVRGTYFVTGNHETYLGLETAFAALAQTPVVILKDEVRDLGGLKLIGVSYPERGDPKDLVQTLAALTPQFAGQPNILLYHAPVSIDRVSQSGVNLELAGHTHKGQQFPFGLITALVHQGYDYGLYRLGDYTLYTSSGVGTWGPPMRIGTDSEIVALTLE